jgi:hypothetical protein
MENSLVVLLLYNDNPLQYLSKSLSQRIWNLAWLEGNYSIMITLYCTSVSHYLSASEIWPD